MEGLMAKKKAPKKVAKAAKKAPKAASKKAVTKTAGLGIAKATPKRDLTVRSSGFEKIERTRTKSQIMAELASSTGLSKREVGNLFDNLEALMSHDLTKGPGVFQVPGLLKLMVIKKKAVPARKGVNPFTGEETMFKAKPARNVVKARPLKALKDMVAKKS
jgi:nucleoid DNA-binding protein